MQTEAPSTGLIEVLGPEGHIEFKWDKHDPKSVEATRTKFNEFISKKRYRAFKMNADGSKGEQADSFDPEHERYLISPPLRGG